MIHTLIVPGLDGSPAAHWQGDWAACDPHALMVDLSIPDRPVPAVWEIELASAILSYPNCVLVGHSLGAALIVRLLTKWPHLKVAGALLVAPADTEGGNERISHFGTMPYSPLSCPSLVVGSRNDPWMSFERAQRLADAWGAGFVDQGHAGHINVASGYGPWREAWALRDRLRHGDTQLKSKRGFQHGFKDFILNRAGLTSHNRQFQSAYFR